MLNYYGYEKCSTCKKAKAWLKAHGIPFVENDLITQTPSKEELAEWMEKSGLPLRRFFNTSGILYREMNLKEKVADLNLEEAAALLASNGKLIRRPLLILDGKFLVNGFKEDTYEELLK